MPHRFSNSTAAVVMLVLLRLNIGWHFFSEGVKHYTDPHWTSEPTLRSAKGPLAPLYRSYLTDFHRMDEALHRETAESEAHAAQAFSEAIEADWEDTRQKFSQHFDLDEAQQKQTLNVLGQYRSKLHDWFAGNKDALITHVHEWRRRESTLETPAAQLPFQKGRLAAKQSLLAGEANGWRAELKTLEAQYDNDLAALVDPLDRDQNPFVRPATPLDRVDMAMTYGILAIGLLLLLGLFTPVACLAGAVFLLSVVTMQPFWVSDSLPTYNQYVEMFALLALATVPVGRWAGLDFFLHNLMTGSCCRAKGKPDVSQS